MSKLLITGAPGVGKTTLVKKVAGRLEAWRPVGFYTEEIREAGVRMGFDLVDFSGKRQVLAKTNLKSPFRVGKYGVDVRGFERFLDAIPFLDDKTRLVIIDEIGKMECHSQRFQQLIWDVMNSDKTVIGTVAAKGGGIITDVKKHPGVRFFELTTANRDSVLSRIIDSITEDEAS
jgi:nucleoside-triphosphatase